MNSNNNWSLEEAVESGQLHLGRLSFDEADASFRRVLEGLTSSHPHGDRLRMTSLVGLAEINVRRSRSVISDVEEWLHQMLCALALHKEAMEIAETAIDRKWNSAGLPVDNNNFRCFEEVLKKSAAHAKVIEGELSEVIRQEIVVNCAKSKPGMYLKRKPVFDVDWLRRLTDYCVTGKRRSKASPVEGNNNHPQPRVDELTADEDKAIESSSNHVPTTTWKRKIDYDRLQEGIRKIVSEVSRDVRNQYLQHSRLVPGQVMQKRHLHELMARLSPGNRDNEDLLGVLDDAVRYEDYTEPVGEDGGGQDPVEVESRKSFAVAEEIQRSGSRRSFRIEDRSEIDSVEWEEILKKEDRMHRNKEKEKEVENDEDEDEDDAEYVSGRRFVQSGQHTSIVGFHKKSTKLVKYDRSSCVKSGVRNAISFCARDKDALRRPSDFFVQSDVQSRKQNSDFRNGTSVVSESGQSVGGLSGAFCTSGILTLWRSTRPAHKANRPDPRATKELHNFEAVSPLTERDKVLRWLQSVEPEPRPKSLDRGGRVAVPTTHPSGDRVGQTIGHLVLSVADSFREDGKGPEAYEMYKFAMGLFQKYPLAARQGQTQVVADLLLRVGMVKCSMGQLATGSQLMEESVGLLERSASASASVGAAGRDAFKVAKMWFQVGNVYLADRVRRESLQARVMQLIRDDVEDEEEDGGERDRGSEKSDQFDSYCVCIQEALACYKRSLSVLDSVEADCDRRIPELAIDVFSNMADCYVMTGNLDLAEVGYEEALRLFPQTQGAPLLTRNAHVLSMLGTVSFLLRNFVRSATMFETSNILLQHLQNSEESPTLDKAWTSTMLGLSYSSLDRHDKAAACCIRAFTLYTRFFRGRILDVDGLSRWFIVQTLYVLGIAYTTLDSNDKALYYLNLARNMTANSAGDSSDDDAIQHVQVLRAIADAYSALEVPDKALVYYEEALERSKSLGDENTATALKNQLLNRMAGANVDSQQYTAAGGNLEQALDYQKDVESSIKDDMIAILLRLGVTSVLACDLDKAIGCYTDCIQAYDDCRRKPNSFDLAGVMASLGTLCHVKGCMQDDDEDVDAFMDRAEAYFEEAYQLTGTSSPVCVQYANFLYQQGRYGDAIVAMLPYVFCARPAGDEVRYNGIEQAVLPDHLQYDADDEDTLVLEARVFAKFLAVLCYKYLGLSGDAEEALVGLYAAAAPSTKPFNLVVLGYGLMEMGLFEEAAGSFMAAARLQPVDCKQTYRNARLCILVYAYQTVARAVDFLLEYIYERSFADDSTWTLDEQIHRLHVTSSGKTSGSKVVVGSGVQVLGRSPSEYFTDLNNSRRRVSLGSVGPSSGSDLGGGESKTTNEERFGGRPAGDRSVGSGDSPVSSGGQVAASEDDAEREEEVWEEWTTEEVIVETPREILELIANQINRQRNLLTSSAYRHQPHHQRWNKSIDQIPNSPSKTDLLLDHTGTGTLSRETSFQYGSSFDDGPLDNAAYSTESENNRFPPEQLDHQPEVNGNKIDTDSSDEWVVTEEIIETPAEIIALLRRTCSNVYQ